MLCVFLAVVVDAGPGSRRLAADATGFGSRAAMVGGVPASEGALGEVGGVARFEGALGGVGRVAAVEGALGGVAEVAGTLDGVTEVAGALEGGSLAGGPPAVAGTFGRAAEMVGVLRAPWKRKSRPRPGQLQTPMSSSNSRISRIQRLVSPKKRRGIFLSRIASISVQASPLSGMDTCNSFSAQRLLCGCLSITFSVPSRSCRSHLG